MIKVKNQSRLDPNIIRGISYGRNESICLPIYRRELGIITSSYKICLFTLLCD